MKYLSLFLCLALVGCFENTRVQTVGAAYTVDLATCYQLSRSRDQYDMCADRVFGCAKVSQTLEQYQACVR